MKQAKPAATQIGKVKVKVKIKDTPAVHIHGPKQVVVKANPKTKAGEK